MQHLLFLGDSVTDCQRKRAARHANTTAAMGKGWVYYVHHKLVAKTDQITVWNRGFAGSLTHEMNQQNHWWPLSDEASMTVDIATVMIGINDIWHPIWKSRPHDITTALNSFRSLLQTVTTRGKHAVVCEPIALPCGEVTPTWWEPLRRLTDGQRDICREFGCHWLELQEPLLKDSHGRFQDYLHDGVHPTDLGHRWLSLKWLNFIRDQELLPTLF